MQQSLVVFSHLRWSFVHQRPQHLISRLASRYRVYFFEEPFTTEGQLRLEMDEPAPGVHVCRPHTHSSAPGFHDDQIPALRQLLDPSRSNLSRRRSYTIAWTSYRRS